MRTLSRRHFMVASGAAAIAAATNPTRTRAAGKPNVLYVFSDMQRAYSMGCYGDPNARTPVLDAFAKQGARLDAAISNTPVCCPYRACLMTGQYAHHHGMMSNGVDFLPKVKCIAETFRDAGYVTGYTGKWHLDSPKEGAEQRRFGFPPVNTRFGNYKTSRNSPEVTEVALDFIAEQSKGDAPWMMFVSYVLPHSPYKAPDGYADHFKNITLPPNVPEGLPTDYARQNLPDYYGMIESIDDEFKRILDALDAAGVAGNTIVVYSSDHGDMVGCQGLKVKRWPHEESARIPFLIRYPGVISAGRVIADPVGAPDFYPTLAGLAGVPVPEGLDGMDFSPLFRGETDRPPRDYVYLEMAYAYVPWPGWRALRTRTHMYARTKDRPWLLFDLKKDPFEMHNLVEDPAHAGLVKEFDDQLALIMHETGDSWALEAHSGDLQNWVPGGKKQQSQNLGTSYPGQAPVLKGGRKRRNKGSDE